MTASGTQVDVKLGASADGIAVDIGVSARASCRKTSAWPSPAWPSPSRTRSTAWARCRAWLSPDWPSSIPSWPAVSLETAIATRDSGMASISFSRRRARSVPDDQERHRRGHGECGRQPAHGGRQRPAARRRGRQLSAEVRRRPQPWRRRPDPDVLLQGSVLGPAPELRDGRAVAAEPHRQEQGRGASGASRRAVGHGGLLGLDHAGPGGEQSLPDGRAGRLLLPGHAAHQHQRCAEPGRECRRKARPTWSPASTSRCPA